MTPEQVRAAAHERAQEAVRLRQAGLSWLSIGRRLNMSAGNARTVVVRELHARGEQLGPPPKGRTGRPYGSRNGSAAAHRGNPASGPLYKVSLARAWRSRGWTWERIAGALQVATTTVRGWCR